MTTKNSGVGLNRGIYESPYDAFTNYMNILGDFIKRVDSLYPIDIDNEELNALLTTIKNQGDEIEELHKELEKHSISWRRRRQQRRRRKQRLLPKQLLKLPQRLLSRKLLLKSRLPRKQNRRKRLNKKYILYECKKRYLSQVSLFTFKMLLYFYIVLYRCNDECEFIISIRHLILFAGNTSPTVDTA